MENDILYSDPDIAVCLKPAGIASEEGGMPELLRGQLGGDCFCVHRLDKPAGGVMVYARTSRAAASLSKALASGRFAKNYLTVVQGAPDEPEGSMRDLIFHDTEKNKSYVVSRPRRGVKEALLSYALLDTREWEGKTLSALRIALHTGRSHQIRVQFASRGMPLVGDGRYGSELRTFPLALWSERLIFPHPADGREMNNTSPPPACFPWTEFSLHNPTQQEDD